MRRERILPVILLAVGTSLSIAPTIYGIRPDKFVMLLDQFGKIGHAPWNVSCGECGSMSSEPRSLSLCLNKHDEKRRGGVLNVNLQRRDEQRARGGIESCHLIQADALS